MGIFSWRKKDPLHKFMDREKSKGNIAGIRWDELEWLIVDAINYKGKEYIYLVEDVSDELERADNFDELEERLKYLNRLDMDEVNDFLSDMTVKIRTEFIYRTGKDLYANVKDPELKSKLIATVGAKHIGNLSF